MSTQYEIPNVHKSKKKKKLKKVLDALIEIKNGSRKEQHGICNNLYFKVDCTDTIEQFISYSFSLKYGDPDIKYPIEGDRYVHTYSTTKWDSSTKHGTERLELLDFMIKTCEGLL